MRFRAALLGLAVSAAALILWRPILVGVASFMAIGAPLERADAVVPLYQDQESIAAATAAIYRAGYARRVILHQRAPRRLETLGLRPPPHELWRALLEIEGIPATAIEVIGEDIENETELGAALEPALGGRAARVIVLAAAPLSRLSRDALRRGLTDSRVDIRMHPVFGSSFDARTWWRSTSGCQAYFDAYCLWLLRFVR